MDVSDFAAASSATIEQMELDGYSEASLKSARRAIRQYSERCGTLKTAVVDKASIESFCDDKLGIVDPADRSQAWLSMRKPLLAVVEMHERGGYLDTHQRLFDPQVPDDMSGAFSLIAEEFVGSMEALGKDTLRGKMALAARFLTFASENGIEEVGEIDMALVDSFMESLSGLSKTTLRGMRGKLRELLDWMAGRGMIAFTGHDAFPVVRGCRNDSLPSVFSSEEVGRMLSCIDNSTARGKLDLAVMSLFAIAGLRCGDVAALDLPHIDWDARVIRLVQGKTGRKLAVPLVDGILYPLADYVRNARPACAKDPDALFVTMRAPRKRMASSSSYYRIVARCMAAAGIDPGARHHGPHSLRHSLATSMLEEGVPLPSIAGILGHASVKTTEVYLLVNVAGGRELAMEVPL